MGNPPPPPPPSLGEQSLRKYSPRVLSQISEISASTAGLIKRRPSLLLPPLPPPLSLSLSLSLGGNTKALSLAIFTERQTDAPPAECLSRNRRAASSRPFFSRARARASVPRRRSSFDGHYLYDQSHRSLSLRAALHGGCYSPLQADRGAPRRAGPLYTSNGTCSLLYNLADVIGRPPPNASGRNHLRISHVMSPARSLSLSLSLSFFLFFPVRAARCAPRPLPIAPADK